MVTVAEAQAQVSAARKELDAARTQGQIRKAEIKLAKVESQRVLRREVGIGTITSQALIRQQVGRGGVRQEITRRRRRARRGFETTGLAISGAERELVTFEAQFPGREVEIAGVESEIASATRIQARQQRTADAFRAARKAFLSPSTAGIFALSTREEREFFRQFEAGSQVLQPTLTEVQLQQSLPVGLRDLPAEDVIGLGGQIFVRQSLAPQVQSIIPASISPIQTGTQQLGGVILSRRELEELRQQSLPLGTTGIIPAEQVREFGVREFLTTEIPPLAAARRGVFGFGTRVSAGVPGVLDVAFQRRVTPSIGERGLGLGIRGVSTIIPTTPLGVGVTGALVATTIFAPPVVVGFIGAGVTGVGIAGALDPRLTTEERVGSGIVAGLGAVSVVASVTPFIRGLGVRGTSRAPEGFELVPGVRGVGDIGLIQPGGVRPLVDLPRTSPLRRGAFGLRPSEVEQFLGPGQALGTAQRGLFEPGVDIPIQRPFFVTPQDPTTTLPVARISRLGLVEPFTSPTSIQIGFGLPPTPQIGITIGGVARGQVGRGFAIGRGSELEAIRTSGIITGVRGLGRTRIGGQGVDIFAFEIGRGPTAPSGFGLPSAKQFRTSLGRTRVSGEGLLASFGVRPTRGITSGVRSTGLISSRIFGRTGRVTTRDVFGTGRITPPTIRTPPPTTPTTGLSGISGLGPTTGLGTFGISFPSFEPTPPPARPPRGGRRRPIRRTRFKGPGLQAQLAPSFTAIAADLRGVFPTELRVGGISPRQIRVLPRRRRRRRS